MAKIKDFHVKLKTQFPTNLLNFLHLILLVDILPIFLPNPPMILHILLHLKLPTQIQILFLTKNFTVLHQKILCIEFPITKLISSVNTHVLIFNISVKFPFYIKFQELILLVEEPNHSVRIRLLLQV